MTPLNHSVLFPFYLRRRIQIYVLPKRFDNEEKNPFSVMCAAIAAGCFRAGPRARAFAGINEATSLMTSYFDPATKLCYAIGAVLGLVGGIKTYGKFSSGDPRHLENRRQLVLCLHLSDCSRHHPAFLLPLSGMEYPVNKGAGNPVEFKGLKSQYLFVFAGGLVTVLLAVVILYLAGVDQWICIPFRDRIRRSVGMGGVPAERPLRRTRSYEAAGGETPSALPDPPQREFSDYFAKKKNDNHEKCIESGNALERKFPPYSRWRTAAS